jgi:hypothetical protein
MNERQEAADEARNFSQYGFDLDVMACQATKDGDFKQDTSQMHETILYRRIRELEATVQSQKLQIRELEQERHKLLRRQVTLEKWLRKKLTPELLEIALHETENIIANSDLEKTLEPESGALEKDLTISDNMIPENLPAGPEFYGPLCRISPWVEVGTPVIVDGCIPGIVIKSGRTQVRILLGDSAREEVHFIGGNRVHYGPKK